jgi:hypothetical protein
VRLFHQRFELVATASASFQYPLGLEANPNASCGRKVSSTNASEVAGFGGEAKSGAQRKIVQWTVFWPELGRRSPSPSVSFHFSNFVQKTPPVFPISFLLFLLRDSPNDDLLIHLPDCRCRILLTCPCK